MITIINQAITPLPFVRAFYHLSKQPQPFYDTYCDAYLRDEHYSER
jgi:hypothetical protein